MPQVVFFEIGRLDLADSEPRGRNMNASNNTETASR